jgi:hypothetical protein
MKEYQMNAFAVNIPQVMLMHDRAPMGPLLLRSCSGPQYTAIFGFSNKQSYKLFCTNCVLPTQPYPLAKRHLRDLTDGVVRLIIIDASGPCETQFHAATVENVLNAESVVSGHVTVSYRLTFDPELRAYHVEKASLAGPNRSSLRGDQCGSSVTGTGG